MMPFFKKFHVHLAVEPCDISVLEVLKPRIQSAKEFYVDTHGAWIDTFLENLGDELSRISFKTYMQQRITAHIIQDSEICYPVTAPLESADWRAKRLSMEHDLPSLEGCSDVVRNFFYHDTYILEQYAIENVISAEPGDTVIDAGAFIADTAIYFSRKVGETGKIYGFETDPEIIRHAENNLKANNCHNVCMVNNAVSDSKDIFYMVRNPLFPCASYVIDAEDAKKMEDTDNLIRVESLTLDDFVLQHNIKIDYIKSDIEGAEMRLLRGATKTIARDKPKLGLSLYHCRDDFWQMPQIIQKACPEYTFYFRCECEPVLFAKVENK